VNAVKKTPGRGRWPNGPAARARAGEVVGVGGGAGDDNEGDDEDRMSLMRAGTYSVSVYNFSKVCALFNLPYEVSMELTVAKLC